MPATRKRVVYMSHPLMRRSRSNSRSVPLAPVQTSSHTIAYKKASALSHATLGCRVAGHLIGSSSVTWLIGPAYIESTYQMVEIGTLLHSWDVKFIRARAVRSQELGERGESIGKAAMRLLKATADRFALNIVSEVSDVKQLDFLAAHCELLEVRPRGFESITLLQELSRVNKTIILHRGTRMTVEDYLSTLRYLERGGNSRIVLADSGVNSYDARATQLFDLSSIVTLKRETPYPVIFDCSTFSSNAVEIAVLGQSAVAAGADGLMIEIDAREKTRNNQNERGLAPSQLRSMMQRISALKSTLNAIQNSECCREFEAKEKIKRA